MATIETRHQVDAHHDDDGETTLFVRLAVCVDGRAMRCVQGPMSVEQAKRFRASLDAKIREAECPPSPTRRVASSAKSR